MEATRRYCPRTGVFAGNGDGMLVDPLSVTPPTIEPAQAAESPPTSQMPAGAVRPLAGHPQAAVFDGATHQLAVLSPGSDPTAPASLALFGDSPRLVTLPGPATALAADERGKAYLAGRGGYFVVDLATAHATQVNVAEVPEAQFTAIARRADGKLVLGSADGTVYTLASSPGAGPETGPVTIGNRIKIFTRVDSLVTQGNTTAVLDRGQTSRDDDRRRRSCRAGAAGRRRRNHYGCRPAGPGPGRRHPRRRTAGVRRGPADLASGLPGARRAIRSGRFPRLGLGVPNSIEHRHWLRSDDRNSPRKGAIPNRAATQLAGLRRSVGHLVCGVGVRCGSPGHRARGGPPASARWLPVGWETDLSDEYEWVPLRLPPDVTRLSASTRLSIEAEYRGWELTRVRLYTDGSRRVLLRRKKSRAHSQRPDQPES